MLNFQFPMPAGGSLKLALNSGSEARIVCSHGKLRYRSGSVVSQDDDMLGRITSGPSGIKLQAVQTLLIVPGNASLSSSPAAVGDGSNEGYKLEPMVDGRCEIIFLRHGDIITSPGTLESVSCVWVAPEVQVNSSALNFDHARPSETKDGVGEMPEDETEDEAALDDTVTEVPVTQPVTQPTKSQFSTTPLLPKDRSLVVHETPTANRIFQDDFDAAPSNEARHIEATPPPPGAIAVAETFSTARTDMSPSTVGSDMVSPEFVTNRKRPQGSPQVRVGRQLRKRQSLETSPGLGVTPATEEPPVKRTKTAAIVEEEYGDNVQASPLDDVNANPNRMTYSVKGKRRATAISEGTPTKLSRSSQRSTTATTITAYEGPTPRVATSNSSIKEDGSTIRFLRKQGGILVKNVEDKCNVLCIRDGSLSKTMKFIQAIALGVPVVTDKWLTESARADGLLDLASFKPSVAQEEKEWKFNLENVWGIPQTPFKGYAIYFTLALKKTYTNFREMEKACQTLGAKVVPKRNNKNDKIIVLATEEGDPEAEKIIEEGEPCYLKDLLTTSILRGKLDLESDEFKIKVNQAGSRRKGQKKNT